MKHKRAGVSDTSSPIFNIWGMSSVEKIQIIFQKIAGRKRPALVDPSHKVRQGGKGRVFGMDRRTDGI